MAQWLTQPLTEISARENIICCPVPCRCSWLQSARCGCYYTNLERARDSVSSSSNICSFRGTIMALVNVEFIEKKSIQWEPSCFIRTDRRTDGKTEGRMDTLKLIVAFRNFANNNVIENKF
jgi:hypothetical protein